MKKIRKKITVPVSEAETIKKFLSMQPESEDQCLGENETMTYTAQFGHGMEMDIKVCGVQFEEGGDNRPWTEAVLFKDGHELCCSEPDDIFFQRLDIDIWACGLYCKRGDGKRMKIPVICA